MKLFIAGVLAICAGVILAADEVSDALTTSPLLISSVTPPAEASQTLGASNESSGSNSAI